MPSRCSSSIVMEDTPMTISQRPLSPANVRELLDLLCSDGEFRHGFSRDAAQAMSRISPEAAAGCASCQSAGPLAGKKEFRQARAPLLEHLANNSAFFVPCCFFGGQTLHSQAGLARDFSPSPGPVYLDHSGQLQPSRRQPPARGHPPAGKDDLWPGLSSTLRAFSGSFPLNADCPCPWRNRLPATGHNPPCRLDESRFFRGGCKSGSTCWHYNNR